MLLISVPILSEKLPLLSQGQAQWLSDLTSIYSPGP